MKLRTRRRSDSRTGSSVSSTRDLSDGEIADAATARMNEAMRFRFDPRLGEALYAGIGPAKPTTVVIEVDADHASEAASYKWHDKQKIQTRRSGAVRLTFTCGNYAPLVAWILRFGSHAVVRKPSALADIVAEQLRATVSLYKSRRKRR